jgi:hypothetical protein
LLTRIAVTESVSLCVRKKSTVHKRENHPFKIFRLPPEGFDPRKASAWELLLHGVPKWPDAETHPKLQLLWDQIAEWRPRFVEPAFLPMEKFHRSKLHDHRSLFDITPVKFRPRGIALPDPAVGALPVR